MTAFGNLRHVSGSVPNQERFTQPCPRRNYSDWPVRNWFADIQGNDVTVLQTGNSVRDSLQVIYQINGFEAQSGGERRFIQDQGKLVVATEPLMTGPGTPKTA